MICLTGDIHHDGLVTNEQLWLRDQGRDVSEVRIALDYVRLCEKHGVKCTLYTTGRTLAEQWDAFQPIADSSVVEVGGHTYGGLPRSTFSRLWAWLTGGISISHSHSHGSYTKQQRDTQRMMGIARKRLGHDIVSWRSHGLVVDENTYPILADAGIRFISDETDWSKLRPERTPEGLISHPMNVIMDHDHIYHAHRTREYVEKQKKNWTFEQDPTMQSYDIGPWGELVGEQVRKIEEQGGVATVLMHPLCMYVADEFETLERLLEQFSASKTIWAREVGEFVQEAT